MTTDLWRMSDDDFRREAERRGLTCCRKWQPLEPWERAWVECMVQAQHSVERGQLKQAYRLVDAAWGIAGERGWAMEFANRCCSLAKELLNEQHPDGWSRWEDAE